MPARRVRRCGARSGRPDTCCSGARRRAPTGGSAAPSDCSSASATTASNRATCWSRRCSRTVGRDDEAACATAAQAAAIGERFGDRGPASRSSCRSRGTRWSGSGASSRGCALIDETMVAVVAGELSPIVTGLIYCNTIAFCQARARAAAARASGPTRSPSGASASPTWSPTPASAWCTAPRSWNWRATGTYALEEARRAGERFGAASARRPARRPIARPRSTACAGSSPPPSGRTARPAACGFEPQPGIALLRLAQGREDAAAARSAARSPRPTDPLRRLRLLPACVEILLAAGDVEEARERRAGARADRRAATTAAWPARWPRTPRGAVGSAEGDAGAALHALRRACRTWQELGVPYEAARARVLVALACRRAGRRGRRRARARGRRATRSSALGAADDAARVAAARTDRAARPDAAPARGAAAGRGRADQPGDRRRARDLRAHRRPPRAEHPRASCACARAPPRARSPSSTTSLTWSEMTTLAGRGWLIRAMRAPARRRSVAPVDPTTREVEMAR